MSNFTARGLVGNIFIYILSLNETLTHVNGEGKNNEIIANRQKQNKTQNNKTHNLSAWCLIDLIWMFIAKHVLHKMERDFLITRVVLIRKNIETLFKICYFY